RLQGDWSSDVCSSDLLVEEIVSHTSGRDALQARLDELERRTGIEVVLEDGSGNRVAGSASARRHGPGTFSTRWAGGTAWIFVPQIGRASCRERVRCSG